MCSRLNCTMKTFSSVIPMLGYSSACSSVWVHVYCVYWCRVQIIGDFFDNLCLRQRVSSAVCLGQGQQVCCLSRVCGIQVCTWYTLQVLVWKNPAVFTHNVVLVNRDSSLHSASLVNRTLAVRAIYMALIYGSAYSELRILFLLLRACVSEWVSK